MAKKRTARPFNEELPDLLRERALSLRALARLVGVGNDHLSRVLRGARDQRASGDLTRRVATALDLPEDYFPEARLAFIATHLNDHPQLRDKFYDQLHRAQLRATSRHRTQRP